MTYKIFDNYVKLVIQFSKTQNINNNYIYVDIIMKMNSGVQYPAKLQTYGIIYGVRGWQASVSPSVYDALWDIDVGKIMMREMINMRDKEIIGLKDTSDPTGAVNLELMSQNILTLENDIKRRLLYKKNVNYYDSTFEEFFDCLDADSFNVDINFPFPAVVKNIGDKLIFKTGMNLKSFDIKKGGWKSYLTGQNIRPEH